MDMYSSYRCVSSDDIFLGWYPSHGKRKWKQRKRPATEDTYTNLLDRSPQAGLSIVPTTMSCYDMLNTLKIPASVISTSKI